MQQFRVTPDLTLVGSSAADELAGGNGDDILDGAKGNDVLTGNLGSDQFIVRLDGGQDTIVDFDASEGDRLVFTGFEQIDTAAEVMGFGSEVGNGVLLDFGHTDVLLLGTTLAEVQGGLLFG